MAYDEREKKFFVKGVNRLHDVVEEIEQAWFAGKDPHVKAILDSLRKSHSEAADLHYAKLEES